MALRNLPRGDNEIGIVERRHAMLQCPAKVQPRKALRLPCNDNHRKLRSNATHTRGGGISFTGQVLSKTRECPGESNLGAGAGADGVQTAAEEIDRIVTRSRH